MAEEVNVHCWEDGPRTHDGCGSTCMKEHGHDGPHQFVRDDEIMVQFTPAKEAKE
jgi:hypothetical protein